MALYWTALPSLNIVGDMPTIQDPAAIASIFKYEFVKAKLDYPTEKFWASGWVHAIKGDCCALLTRFILQEFEVRLKNIGLYNDDFPRGIVFLSYYHQGPIRELRPVTALPAYLALWLKKLFVSSLPRETISIRFLYQDAKLAYGWSLSLLAAMV